MMAVIFVGGFCASISEESYLKLKPMIGRRATNPLAIIKHYAAYRLYAKLIC